MAAQPSIAQPSIISTSPTQFDSPLVALLRLEIRFKGRQGTAHCAGLHSEAGSAEKGSWGERAGTNCASLVSAAGSDISSFRFRQDALRKAAARLLAT